MLVVGAGVAAIVVSQTAWFKNWLRGYVVKEANQYLNGTLSIDKLRGNLFSGVELENIGIWMDGTEVLAVKGLGVRYSVREILTKGLSIDEIHIDHPAIVLRKDGDTWSLSRLLKEQSAEARPSRSGPSVTVSDIGISDGSVVIEGPVGTSGVAVPDRFDHVDAKVAFTYQPAGFSVGITNVSFRASDPALALNALSGGITVTEDTLFVEKLAIRTAESSVSIDGHVRHYLTSPDMNLQATSDRLSIPEIGRLVPALSSVQLQPAFQVKVDGPLDRLGIDMNVRSSAGSLSGQMTAGLLAPHQSIAGTLSIEHIDLAPILNDKRQKSDITADARMDIRGEPFSDLSSLRGSVSLRAPRIKAAGYVAGPLDARTQIDGRRVNLALRAAAYKATATASGRLTLPDFSADARSRPIAFDLRGRTRGLDLRQLPADLKAPRAQTQVNADYHVSGTIVTGARPSQQVTADARFKSSTVAGARIVDGSTVNVTAETAPARGVRTAPPSLSYSADLTVTNVDLERLGREFEIPALATDRYRSIVNVHAVADGHGTAPAEINVTGRGELTDTSILGGQIPQLSFEGTLANDAAHVTVDGRFEGFNPAVVAGKPSLDGKVGGSVEASATVANVSSGVALDQVQATARVDLDPSTIGGLDISWASVDGDYHDSVGIIRAFDVTGRDLNVSATGTLALNDTDQSNLKVHADSPSLQTLGKLAGVPLTGIAKVDATVTGNRTGLQAAGNLTADGAKYGGNGALAASSDFTVRIANLDAASLSATATTHATFVTLGGQNINELTAKTGYDGEKVETTAEKTVDFDVTAKQPQRSLAAVGSLVLHPDHQEVRLRSLQLASQGVEWQTPRDLEATVTYADSAVTVENFRLVSGAQEITAEGAFGKPGNALKIGLHDIDASTIDALLLRPPQLSGRLEATTTIRGSKDDPRIEGELAIRQGGFRQFKYDELRVTASYADKGATVDARLDQNPTTWLTAKGYAPISSDAKRQDYDLHIDSSPIDLGLVQGFTTAVTNVKGTLQAKVDVRGMVGDPLPSGVVSIEKAAFKVQPTGVSYSQLDGQIDLQPDRVHIDQIRVLDSHKSPLTVSGDLAIREREVSGVSISVQAKNFQVIDDEMGNLRVNSALQLTGQLSAPRVEGSLGVATGRLDLDNILAHVGESAYATKETEITDTSTQGASAEGQASTPSAREERSGVQGSPRETSRGMGQSPINLDAMQVDVRFTIPDDLVVKGNDLRAPGSSVGLGALNLTLGGDISIDKVPWDQLRLYGSINTIRGTYDFQGRRFTILRNGTVRFEGTDDIDPTLDLRTERVIQAVTARVNVQGTLQQPKIVLSSVPPLEQADILALIIFNQPTSSLGEGQQVSLAQRAQSMAIGTAAGQVSQSIARALNLDTFEINAAPESGGGPQVAVGQQVGQNLYVKIEQGIGGDQSQTNFIMEYELTKWLRFRTNVLQGSSTQTQIFQRAQGSGVDLLFFFSY